MLNEFTFVTISYNQAEYIEDHINSIKSVVDKYGAGRKIDYVLADDCSKDETTIVARNLLNNYTDLFRSVTIIERKENIGTVRNIFDAVDHVNTTEFKILGADDQFICKDVFNIYETNRKDHILWTCVEKFGGDTGSSLDDPYFRYMLKHNTSEKIKWLLRYKGVFSGPSVFFSGELYRDPELRLNAMKYKYIDDAPTMRYLLKKCSVSVTEEQYIRYRVGAGISSSSAHDYNDAFKNELVALDKASESKMFKYPKYINPYRYYSKLLRMYIEKFW